MYSKYLDTSCSTPSPQDGGKVGMGGEARWRCGAFCTPTPTLPLRAGGGREECLS